MPLQLHTYACPVKTSLCIERTWPPREWCLNHKKVEGLHIYFSKEQAVQSLVRKELSSHNLHRCGDCLHVEMFTRAQLVILITFVGVVIVSIGKDGGGGEPTWMTMCQEFKLFLHSSSVNLLMTRCYTIPRLCQFVQRLHNVLAFIFTVYWCGVIDESSVGR